MQQTGSFVAFFQNIGIKKLRKKWPNGENPEIYKTGGIWKIPAFSQGKPEQRSACLRTRISLSQAGRILNLPEIRK